MTVLKVLEYPAKSLLTKAPEVEVFDAELKKFVADMHETMLDANGIGLAANQVGVLKRVLTILIPHQDNQYEDDGDEQDEDESSEPKMEWHDKKYTFINPVITKKQGKIRFQEGCLSFPEIYENVDRAAEIWVDAFDENGKKFSIHADGLFSICLQHEIDHLDGIVFIDRMSRLKQSIVKKKMQKRGSMD